MPPPVPNRADALTLPLQYKAFQNFATMSLAIASETYFFSSVQLSHFDSLAGESKTSKRHLIALLLVLCLKIFLESDRTQTRQDKRA